MRVSTHLMADEVLVYWFMCVCVHSVWCYLRQQMANVQLSVNRHKCIYLRLFVLHISFFLSLQHVKVSSHRLHCSVYIVSVPVRILKRWAAVEYKCFSNARFFFFGRDMDINLFQFFSPCLQTILWFYCDRFVIFLLYSIIDDDNHRSNKLEN